VLCSTNLYFIVVQIGVVVVQNLCHVVVQAKLKVKTGREETSIQIEEELTGRRPCQTDFVPACSLRDNRVPHSTPSHAGSRTSFNLVTWR
jgi:hypothetical protein